MCPVLPRGLGKERPGFLTPRRVLVSCLSLSRSHGSRFSLSKGHACLWISALSLQGSEQSCPSLPGGR